MLLRKLGRDMPTKLSYVVCMVHCHCLQNWVLEGNAFGQFHTLREPVTYILVPTKFPENNWIGGRDIPRERNLKQASSSGILSPVPILTTVIFRGPFSYRRTKFQENLSAPG